MSSLRIISTLRSSLLISKYCRILLPLAPISSQYVRSTIPHSYNRKGMQQICGFSSSTILYNRRRDRVDSAIAEDLDENDEDENEEDNQSVQVISSYFFYL